MRLKGIFKPRAGVCPMTWKDVKDSVIRHLWGQRQYHKGRNEGGLKHNFYHKVHSLLFNEEKHIEQTHQCALRSDSYYALDLIGNRTFDTNLDMTEFLQEHPGFVYSSSKGISVEQITDYILDNEESLKDDEYLALMR